MHDASNHEVDGLSQASGEDVRAELKRILAVIRYSSYAIALAMLSMHYLDEDRFEFNHRPPTQRSIEAARAQSVSTRRMSARYKH